MRPQKSAGPCKTIPAGTPYALQPLLSTSSKSLASTNSKAEHKRRTEAQQHCPSMCQVLRWFRVEQAMRLTF
eukprot:scaffold276288_cov21-Tisochrysis_lutea.AAC.2